MTRGPTLNKPSELEKWAAVQEQAYSAAQNEDWDRALCVLEGFERFCEDSRLRCSARAFRGDLQELRGDLNAALDDYLAAHAMAEELSFERCTLEEAIAALFLRQGQQPEADAWYLRALTTASRTTGVCGISVLKALTRLRGSFSLSAHEQNLAEQVVKQSWKLRELPGEPNLTDLFQSAQTIDRAIRENSRHRTRELLP
jgi:hypothetical protein